jgi:trigger factor
LETRVTEQEGSRARVDVDLSADEVTERTNRAARSMAREMRMPGFRKGKAPPSLVIQRVGFTSVLEQALRDALPEWYQQAIIESGVVPIGDPDIEVTNVPDAEGEPLSFHFEVGVRPGAVLGEYLGLEVGRPEAEVPEEIVEREIDRLREGMARLEPVDRPAATGDHLLADFTGRIDGEEFEGGSARDQVIELGSGRLIEGFEEQLDGASAGQEVQVEVTFPEDYGAAELAGREAVFDVSVKEVREKILPEADDDFALEASEFEGIAELREDISKRVAEVAEQRIEQDFRLAAVDAAADNATVEVPDELVKARGEERWERFERQIEVSLSFPLPI